MKKLLTAALFLLSCHGGSAQRTTSFELSSGYDNNRNVVIDVKHHDGGIYSLVLEFYDVENLTTDKFRRARVESPGRIAVIKRENPEKATSYKWRSRYSVGSVNPRKVDTTFVYRLPFGLGESREAHELYNVFDRHRVGGDKSMVNYKAYQFIMSRADTVYAARKGKVIRVIDGYDPKIGMGEVSMTSDNNEVYVEHADGTIARYNALEKGSITVEPGDIVFPNTPIALAGSYDGETYQCRFSLYYQTDNLSAISSLIDYKTRSHYIDPVFATSDGETTLKPRKIYKPVCPTEMVTREMTKRELKAFGR